MAGARRDRVAGAPDQVAAVGRAERPGQLHLAEAEESSDAAEAIAAPRLDRVLARRDRDDRLGDLADVVDQLDPLAGLEDAPATSAESFLLWPKSGV